MPSSIVRTLNETCSITKLYRVNPDEGAEGDMLPKQLLVEFTTRTFGLANYEGMCLGPVLRDGRQTLILIADSQGGSGGLTREYLKVVILP